MSSNSSKKAIIISGPTASGKSFFAEQLYNHFKHISGIINADSMQIYQELPILTSIPESLDHHKLYSYKKYFEPASLGIWFDDVSKTLNNMSGSIPVIVGGTGMYIKALIYGLAKVPDIPMSVRSYVRDQYEDLGKEKFIEFLITQFPEAKTEIPKDKQRILRYAEVWWHTGKSINDFYKKISKLDDYNFLHITFSPDRDWLYTRCEERFDRFIKDGAVEEVKALHEIIGDNQNDYLITNAVGYREIVAFLDNELTMPEVLSKAKQRTRNYAKRQLTWFRHQSEALPVEFDNYTSQLEKQCFEKINEFLSER